MRTLKGNVSMAIAGLVAGGALLGLSASAGAQVIASDETAGLIVFPKVIVDTSAVLGTATDTLIQVTNTDLAVSAGAAAVECNWIDATSHCAVRGTTCPPRSGIPCDTNSDCPPGLECVPCWSETDFSMVLTPGQPIGFRASQGLVLPCFVANQPNQGCLTVNEGGVSNVPSNPFRGELKCYQVTNFTNATPTAENDLKGEATIISSDGTELTAAAYNAVGFQATADAGTTTDDPLCLGGPLADPCGDGVGSANACAKSYAGCPGVLILDHFFWNAPSPLGIAQVRTNLTLAPCSETLFGDLTNQTVTTAQMLIYNEFEQRYSTSTRVQCYKDLPLADIDTRPGPADDASSVFAVGVQGTLTGQTRIRGVEGQEDNVGHGLIGVAQEFYFEPPPGTALIETAAFNLHAQGDRTQGDAICR